MYELSVTEIHTDMLHFSLDREKDQIAGPHIGATDSLCMLPELPGGTRQGFASLKVGVMHQPAAIEAAG